MRINLNQHVAMSAKEDASDRTLERIAEQGGKGFIVRDHMRSHGAFGGGPALLLESLVDGGYRGERWMGWLPLDEIEEITPWRV